ncbi:uncharacterized protein VTP21DRAFT_228 [Calcarisporiella thermophila]|uniref:uncharacterized protein n=1 Tax=Calcarisporiella thermophila TaxID=911321 RepID=UPI00374457FA
MDRQPPFHLSTQNVWPPIQTSQASQNANPFPPPSQPLSSTPVGTAGKPWYSVHPAPQWRSLPDDSSVRSNVQTVPSGHGPANAHANMSGHSPPAMHFPLQSQYGVDPSHSAKRAASQARRAEQNRAAQRAFRQRKIQYVKDLEEKAKELDELKRAYEEIVEENKRLREELSLQNKEPARSGGLKRKLTKAEIPEIKAEKLNDNPATQKRNSDSSGNHSSDAYLNSSLNFQSLVSSSILHPPDLSISEDTSDEGDPTPPSLPSSNPIPFDSKSSLTKQQEVDATEGRNGVHFFPDQRSVNAQCPIAAASLTLMDILEPGRAPNSVENASNETALMDSLGEPAAADRDAMENLCELMNARPHRPNFPPDYTIGLWHVSKC